MGSWWFAPSPRDKVYPGAARRRRNGTMSVSNRIELAPLYLIAVDYVIAFFVAAVTLPLGAAQPVVPLAVLLVVYAGGGYSLVSEVSLRPRVSVVLASMLLLAGAVAGFLLPHPRWALWVAGPARMAAAAAGCVVLVAAHTGLESHLRARSQRFVLHLRPDMRAAGEAIGRHVSRSRYPAELAFDEPDAAAPDRLRAEVIRPRQDSADDPLMVEAFFDPARFCDVALKVLPPAVLDLRGDFVDWQRCERRVYDEVKRAFDVVTVSLLLILSLPFMAVAAVGIAVTDGGPVFFRQARVGRYGRRFQVLKFRTLRAATGPTATPNDGIEDRVFRFGAFLRRTRMDELPQFFNIIRGDMSLIGPRPEMEFFHERCIAEIPLYRKRLLVRPGLSGWAQTRFGHTTTDKDYEDKTAYDLWYIRHRSFLIDARILLKTAGVMLFGVGAR
jgi:lipopolysaccharide/colanic/teichoic acid biosynthesis glycosyltransferase